MDIGGTNLRVGVVEKSKVIHEKRVLADFSHICQSNSPEIAWQKIIAITSQTLLDVLNEFPDCKAVGIGFPGFIDPQTASIMQSPNLPGLFDVDLVGGIRKLIHCPVFVENDALAASYGEYCLLKEANLISTNDSMIYIGLGTGVGGGFIHKGEVFSGEHGVAMEVGHIITYQGGRPCGCGNKGCLEQYASASGVSISYYESKKIQLTAQQIADLAFDGDSDALEAYENAGRALGMALAHIVKVIDVSDVVIGGGMSQAWSLFEGAFNDQLDRDLIPVLRGKVKCHVSTTFDQAGMIGAALFAEHKEKH